MEYMGIMDKKLFKSLWLSLARFTFRRAIPPFSTCGCLLSIFVLFFPKDVMAVRPIFGSINLVAGEGTAGFRDGTFTNAYFKAPLGLAVNPDRTLLFSAEDRKSVV